MWWIEADLDSSVFVIHSGAFLFPVHGWHDRGVVRLAELAQAIADISAGASSRVEFEGRRYAMAFEHDAQGNVRVLYFESGGGGLLYQERISLQTIIDELRKVIDATLNQLVQRRAGADIALLSAARAML